MALLLLLSPQAGKAGAGPAIPFNSRGILITCDSGREYRGFQEVRGIVEEVRRRDADPTNTAL